MITGEGIAICDKEVGSWKCGWRGCRRKAKYQQQSSALPHMTLHFCERHKPSCACGARSEMDFNNCSRPLDQCDFRMELRS